MDPRVCHRCQGPVPPDANFCPACGVPWKEGRGLSRAQLFALAVLVLELIAMFAMATFVVPRITAAVHANGGFHSAFTRMVFAPWWFPSWAAVVAVLGVAMFLRARTLMAQSVMLGACVLIGCVPMLGTGMGIYMATIEVANGAAGP